MVSGKGLDNRVHPVAEKPISEFKKDFPNSCVRRFHGYRFNQIQAKSYINWNRISRKIYRFSSPIDLDLKSHREFIKIHSVWPQQLR
jgi:hypothetical protein